jgi:hypothetical protein
VKYCPDDGLFMPKNVGKIVNTLYLINIVHLLVLRHCSLMYKMHGKTHGKSYSFLFDISIGCLETSATQNPVAQHRIPGERIPDSHHSEYL